MDKSKLAFTRATVCLALGGSAFPLVLMLLRELNYNARNRGRE